MASASSSAASAVAGAASMRASIRARAALCAFLVLIGRGTASNRRRVDLIVFLMGACEPDSCAPTTQFWAAVECIGLPMSTLPERIAGGLLTRDHIDTFLVR